jgi:acetyl-CoA decarbonylase/synthase complex subunit delta
VEAKKTGKTESNLAVKLLELLTECNEIKYPTVDRASPIVKLAEIQEPGFLPPKAEYPGQIVEVRLGATKGEGGTRGKSIVIGGERDLTFFTSRGASTHPPIVACDVFDTKISLPTAIKTHIKDVIEDPAAWAKRCVDKFGADMITLQLTSIDPQLEDTAPKEAAKTVEEVLQAVDVPLGVGGCGNPVKDLAVFKEVSKVAEGERLLISSVSPWMDTEEAAKTIKKFGHVALALSGMDMNEARELNRTLYRILPRDQIVMDTSTASLGSGLEFTFALMVRIRLAALMGDYELQHPMSSGVTNAWFARESWKKMAPQWEPRELRGPLWETVTALSSLLAGVDYFMMMHPLAVKTIKAVIQRLTENVKTVKKTPEWISLPI